MIWYLKNLVLAFPFNIFFSCVHCRLFPHLKTCCFNVEYLLWDGQGCYSTSGTQLSPEDSRLGLSSRGEEGHQQAGDQSVHHAAAEA